MLPGGETLFNSNRTRTGPDNRCWSSQLIATLDDLGYAGNQSGTFRPDVTFCNMIGVAHSLRATGNRFRERALRTGLSALTVTAGTTVSGGARAMNTTALFSPGFSGSAFDQIFGTSGAQHRAVTTMHVIHTGHTMDESLAVHELTHVAQYELVGAMYMPQAIHAQQFGQGYDYKLLDGSLSASITAGRTYADFNREQQAMICEDYYRVHHGLGAEKGGAAPELEHFVADYWGRAGIPFVRLFVEQ